MKLFRDDNTEGYTVAELDALNERWEEKIEELGLEDNTDEYNREASAFADKIAGE